MLLVNDAVLGVLGVVGAGYVVAVGVKVSVVEVAAEGGLIEIDELEQVAALAADIANFEDDGFADAFLKIEVVVVGVGGTEVLPDGVDVGKAAGAGRGEDGRPVGGQQRSGLKGDRDGGVGSDGVAFNAAGTAVKDEAVAEEGRDVDGVVLDAGGAADGEIADAAGLVSEAATGTEVFPVAREDGAEAGADEDEAFVWQEGGEVLVAIVDGAVGVIAEAEVEVQAGRGLPVIVAEERDAVFKDFSDGVSLHNSCGVDLALEEVSEIADVAIGYEGRVGPGIGGELLKGERAALAGVIYVVDLAAADFTAEAELMFADDVRESLSEMGGDIFTAGRGSWPDGIEAGDGDVGGSGKVRGCDSRIKAESHRIKAVVEIGEGLVEEVEAECGLADESGGEGSVVDERPVLVVEGRLLKVGLEVRAGGSGLGADADESAEGDALALREGVIELEDAVVAASGFVGRIEVVA